MHSFLQYTILDHSFLLCSSKVIFWENEKAIILSDLHIGKSGHFRKAGIAIPQNILQQDLFRLSDRIQFFKPNKIIIVGDLFHSHSNKEHQLFTKWRLENNALDIHLIMGNHDILDINFYKENNLITHRNFMLLGNFIFTHDIKDYKQKPNEYCFSGHIHPSIMLQGLGKQNIKLPCYYFTNNYAVIPAFGKFTGTYLIEPKNGDNVFAIAKNEIFKM